MPLLFKLIRKLAEYEREPAGVTGDEQMLAAGLFGAKPAAEAVIAEVGGKTAGFALFHPTFSTWECNAGIWLEDLYVEEELRRSGVGEALLVHLARLAVERGAARLEWAALDWNTPALRFYEKLGAQRQDTWLMHRLEGASLAGLAEERGGGGAARVG